MTRARIRELGITIGRGTPGPHNAITDVPGVLVGHTTLIADDPHTIRTGVTVIVPREGAIWQDHAFAGFHAFNGCGEMTGIHWLTESGLLYYPIALTNTHQVGPVHDAIITYGRENNLTRLGALPVVAETWDGWLNDITVRPITHQHVYDALNNARGGLVAEGSVGGGTGMICHEFKGGIGTASRLWQCASGRYTVGALVQANQGDRLDLRVNGVPVGQALGPAHTPLPWDEPDADIATSSIIIVLATDAPLLPVQCRRLAQRAAVGLARVGGIGHNGSGDLFLAFATGNHIPAGANAPFEIQMIPHAHLNPLFAAAAEAIEEAILNAMTTAETMVGINGRTAHALPLDELQQMMARYPSPNQ